MDYLICLIGYTAFVGNHYDSHPRTVQIFKNLHYFHGSLTIKSTGRFIGQDNLRLSDKGTGDSNTLFLSTGHFIRHVVRPILQSQAIQIFQCHGVTLAATYSLIEKRKRHILYCIFKGNQVKRLKDEPDHTVPVFSRFSLTEVFDQCTIQIILTGIIVIQNTQYIK